MCPARPHTNQTRRPLTEENASRGRTPFRPPLLVAEGRGRPLANGYRAGRYLRGSLAAGRRRAPAVGCQIGCRFGCKTDDTRRFFPKRKLLVRNIFEGVAQLVEH